MVENPFGDDFWDELSVVERFSMVRKMSEKIRVDKELLPEKILLGIESPEEAARLYGIAVGLWEGVFDERQFEKTLARIGRKPANYSSEVKTLRDIRFAGIVLGDACWLSSRDRCNPLSNFTRVLGDFNDHCGTAILKPSADDVLAAMRGYQEKNAGHQFIPCSPESFECFLKVENEVITKCLAEKTPSIKKLHGLRRTSRRFLNLFLLKTLDAPDMKLFNLYAYMRRINNDLGRSLDVCRVDNETGKPQNLVRVPDLTRKMLTDFSQRVVWTV